MKRGIFVWIMLSLALTIGAKEKNYTLVSPNGNLEVNITLGDQITYTVTQNGTVLLDKSRPALILKEENNAVLGDQPKLQKQSRKSVKETIISPLYRFSSFVSEYNELSLSFKGNYALVFRAFNEGVAYRFKTSFKQPIVIQDEIAQFGFNENYTAYVPYSTSPKERDPFAMAFQNLYTKTSIQDMDKDRIAFLPLTVDYQNGTKLTITESDLEAYPGMFIRGGGTNELTGVFAPYPANMDTRPGRSMTFVKERENYIAKVEGTRDYPWRVLAISEKDEQMPINNMVYALASPNRIGDYSWVKGGQVAWDWWNNWGISGVDFKAGINTDTYKYYIDFAAENKIPFVVLDEGWYNPREGDMLRVIPELDLPELIAYANQKQVRLILWCVFNVLDERLDEICKKYADMGIAGFKVDFLDRDDQTAVEMAYRIADMAAKYKLTLDYHGIYKPTGINRTYPNVINFESVFGMEEVKWSPVEKDMMAYDVTMPYIRQMAGYIDYTPGAMRNATKRDFKAIFNNPMSQGTRCHQLAAYIIHDSPLTMLADNPTIYRKEQECTDFIVSIKNTGIDETRVLQGQLGEYIVLARRVGEEWYVGGMTDWTPREVELDFSFLTDGSYQAAIFEDGMNADRQASDYKKTIQQVSKNTKMKLKLASGGGFAITLKKR